MLPCKKQTPARCVTTQCKTVPWRLISSDTEIDKNLPPMKPVIPSLSGEVDVRRRLLTSDLWEGERVQRGAARLRTLGRTNLVDCDPENIRW